jgi:hypothetical protein
MVFMKFFLLLSWLWSVGEVFAWDTAYVNFDEPAGWRCELAQGVWVCQSTLDPDRKESLVMSIAALSSEWDTLENYEDYLKKPREFKTKGDKTIQSEISYTRRRNINGHVWVDSLQHHSELAGFWTRYLATVHEKLAVLVTYIVSDEHYSKMAPQFERMVVSLKLISSGDRSVPTNQADGQISGNDKLGPPRGFLEERLNVKKPSTTADQPDQGTAWIALVVLAAAVAYLIWRRRSGKKSAAKAPQDAAR